MTRFNKAAARPAAGHGIVGRLRRRRACLPPSLASLVPADGRVLGSVPLADDGSRWAVATPRFLTLLGPEGVQVHRGWHEVEHGRWDADSSTFTLSWCDDSPPLVLVVPAQIKQGEGTASVDVAPFARALRQRVESALVYSVTGKLPSGLQATVSVRRDSGGRLYTASNLPPSRAERLDDGDRAALEELLRRARDGVGLPTD
ncbi:hypothetical protein [Actinomyces sp. 594]|uniref:hypothetical protein n=1 Tax=Actinomyces sp. 594 TaxID=2057793 RepID=UPI00280B1755|nr:hypothetical protein [Actinomyces sp. 594]